MDAAAEREAAIVRVLTSVTSADAVVDLLGPELVADAYLDQAREPIDLRDGVPGGPEQLTAGYWVVHELLETGDLGRLVAVVDALLARDDGTGGGLVWHHAVLDLLADRAHLEEARFLDLAAQAPHLLATVAPHLDELDDRVAPSVLRGLRELAGAGQRA